jgi:cardiolipin synthase A/B
MLETLAALWPTLLGLTTFVANVLATGHAVLRKRDVRAAIGWVGVIWLVPVVGAVLYVLLGVNRIRRAALTLRREQHASPALAIGARAPETDHRLAELGPGADHFEGLTRLVDRISRLPLAEGNCLEALVDGDEAYPAMLYAIEHATRSVALATYIFDDGPSGRRFVEALAAASRRGVEVRVLVDAVGARYSRPQVPRLLADRGVPVARFLPAFPLRATPYFNLRNHRKILVVDGTTGFTGGMNLREHCVLASRPAHPTRDLHFRVTGPLVAHLQAIFAEDWAFTTGKRLTGPTWFPALAPAGTAKARGIPDGPDEDFEQVLWTLLGALAAARRTVRILTPYFLPPSSLVSALNVAAMRGVEVDIVLPARGNLRFVEWAMWGQLWQVLGQGCRVWLTPEPFDHSKVMTVDGLWSLIGSANWDPRTLRLNFELCVEAYDPDLARRLDGIVSQRIASARRLTEADVRARPLPVQLRDGVARLFAPYL